MEKPAGWQPIVSELIAKTKEDRPLKSRVAKTISAPVDRSLPYGCAPDWRNLFDEVRDGIEQGEKVNDWYVVTANPEWLRGWKGVLCREVFYHEANVRVIYHAPSTAKNSLALRAQSRVSSSRVAPNESDIIKRISVSLEDMKVRLRGWLGEMEKASLAGNRPKGAFHFFESYITHPFLGILVVPPGSIKRSSLHAPAPLGTWCLISVYPFEQFHYGNQCGIYLNSPSPMLDFYYNSILDFIELGPDAGYLKAVDLKTSRLGKGRKPKATG